MNANENLPLPTESENPETSDNETSISVLEVEPDQTRTQTIDTDVFDPDASLAALRKLPHAERIQALESWKKQYLEQVAGIAKMQTEIRSIIQKNPDISKEDLHGILETESKKNRLDEHQTETAEAVLDTYLDRHAILKAIREEYPDDRDLFKKIFGRTPFGEILVKEGPATLYFGCESALDFATIYNHGHGTLAWMRDVAMRKIGGGGAKGVSLYKAPVPELDEMITAEDFSMHMPMWRGNVRQHEQQHSVRNLFDAAYKRLNDAETSDGEQGQSDSQNTFFSNCSYEIEDKIEDELLANLTSNADPYSVENEMKGHYIDHFINPYEKTLKNILEEAEKKLLTKISVDERKELEQTKEGVIDAIEKITARAFRKKIAAETNSGIESFKQLREYGFTNAEATSLLMVEALPGWPKLAQRLLANVSNN